MAIVRANPNLGFLVQDAGVLLENFYELMMEAEDYDEFIDIYLEAMDTPSYLGITRGGTSINFEQEIRIIEYDYRRVRSVGDFVVDSATPQINATLLIQNTTNLQRIFPMSDVVKDTDKGTYSLRPRMGAPRPTDYMDNLCLVKEMVNGDIQVTTLFRAINTESVTMSGEDKSESEVACIFTGNARDWADTEFAPVEIMTWVKEPIVP